MSKALFISSILNGFAQGAAKGFEIKQKRDEAEADAAYKKRMADIAEQREARAEKESIMEYGGGEIDVPESEQYPEGTRYISPEEGLKAKYYGSKLLELEARLTQLGIMAEQTKNKDILADIEMERKITADQINAEIKKEQLKQGSRKLDIDEMKAKQGKGGVSDKETQRLREKIMGSPPGKDVMALSRIENELANYRSLVGKYGYEAYGAKSSELAASHKALLLSLKDYAALGALQEHEAKLIEEQVPDVSSLSPLKMAQYGVKGGKKGVLSAIDVSVSLVKNSKKNNMDILYQTFPQANVQGLLKGYETLSSRSQIKTGKTISPLDQQALDWANKNPKDPRAIKIKQRLGM